MLERNPHLDRCKERITCQLFGAPCSVLHSKNFSQMNRTTICLFVHVAQCNSEVAYVNYQGSIQLASFIVLWAIVYVTSLDYLKWLYFLYPVFGAVFATIPYHTTPYHSLPLSGELIQLWMVQTNVTATIACLGNCIEVAYLYQQLCSARLCELHCTGNALWCYTVPIVSAFDAMSSEPASKGSVTSVPWDEGQRHAGCVTLLEHSEFYSFFDSVEGF